MANWSNPTLTSSYTNFVTEVKDRDVEVALWFEGMSPTNLPTNAKRLNTSTGRFEKWNGSAWVDAVATFTFPALSVAGAASIAGAVTLSGGTANGVPYLNGSKVLTSGTALVFDGNNFGIGIASPTDGIHVRSTAQRFDKSNAAAVGQLRLLTAHDSYATAWGVGQGVSSTDFALQYFNGSTWADYLRMTTAGNLGLGVTPSAWGSSSRVFEFRSGYGAIAGNSTDGSINVTTNAYQNNASAWIYNNSFFASRYQQVNGQHQWLTAPSGTAGNAITFTQAMTLDASAQLFLGRTSQVDDGQFSIETTGSNNSLITTNWKNNQFFSKMYFNSLYYLGVRADAANRELALIANSNDSTAKIAFYTSGSGTPTERARFDPGGNLIAHSSVTGHWQLPNGTTAQRPTGAAGMIRFNTSLTRYEGHNGTAWSSIGGGATGGGSDDIFYENGQTVTTNYTLTSNKNAMSAGPITIASGITVTVPSGGNWVVV